VDVVVATPGRALDHLRRGTLSLGGIEVLVLDEADEMLDMGFPEDLDAILEQAPDERQTVLFSATLPARITGISRRYLRDPLQVRIAGERPAAGTAPKVRQTAYVVARAYKIAALARVLDVESPEAAIVCCRTRNEVDELGERLGAHGYRAEVLHGGMSQEQRDRVMKKLRGKAADIVIATDVAARGLDIPQLTQVINFDVPSAPEAYVHRIGRVGRAGREGVAITLAEPREHRLMRNIEQLTKRRIDVAPVPSVADLRARRLEGVREALQEVLAEGELDGVRPLVESLAGELDAERVAMAAVKLLAESAGPESDEVIPPFAGGAFGDRHGEQRPSRGAPQRGAARAPGSDRAKPGMARLFIGGGREMGMRPQDIVGAITGEAGIRGSDVGAITITERFSLVEVPEDLAKMVVAALRGRPVKGPKVLVRLERAAGEGFARPREPAWGRRPRRGDEPPSRRPPGRGRRRP
jgi:ATP-dependent RNA helicase DeaD